MRAVVQRVRRAGVTVDGESVARIEAGALILLGVGDGDEEQDAVFLAGKVSRLRIFDDAEGRMNRSVADAGGSLLVVSQFTLYGDCRKGNRPSYVQAAAPERAQALYLHFVEELRRLGHPTGCGRFREHMVVDLENDGPVTLILESR